MNALSVIIRTSALYLQQAIRLFLFGDLQAENCDHYPYIQNDISRPENSHPSNL